jgi:hypothetical protein
MDKNSITREEFIKWYAGCGGRHEAGESAWRDIIAAREPAYETGQVYLDADGVNFLRVGDDWYRFASESLVAHAWPRRPLRKLVPEDEPVTIADDNWTSGYPR